MLAEAIKPDPQLQDEQNIVGQSVAMREIMDVVAQVGPTDITVLITGESGAGKEVIAKAIHASSNRRKKPLVSVNCGAIPEGIIESELFGHERGSFTGASEQRKGYFELADGGTIFLDEIGELPLAAQVKFLRVLENGEFLRVGSSVPRRVNVRIIAATNKDLGHEVRHSRFREDLYFRLRSVNIVVPPLRERPEDIPIFFERFVGETCSKHGIKFRGISTDAMQLLTSYHWPGNVRELRNVVESMLVLEGGKFIEPDVARKYLKEYRVTQEERHLPVPVGKSVEQAERELILRALLDIKGNIMELKNIVLQQAQTLESAYRAQAEGRYSHNPSEEPDLSLEEMERKMIAEALERHKGNRRVAARVLNISERTLYRKIKEYGLG
jgi:transcriptional regulator with PAS, ATPase and Fis domain